LPPYWEVVHEQKPHVAERCEMSVEPELADLQLEMEQVNLHLEVEQADLHLELGQVNFVEIPPVQQLELCEGCSWVCSATQSDTQRGMETCVCVEEQVQEPDSCQSDGGDDGGGDGQLEEQD